MIAIQLDGDSEFIDTTPSTSVSITLENPILGNAEKLSPGSFSFPFDLPVGDASPKNSAKLKNPDVLENNAAYQLQKASLFVSETVTDAPLPFKSGNLKTQTLSGNKASVYFTFGLNSLSSEFKTAKIRSIISETFVISSTQISRSIYVKNLWSSGQHSLEINGIVFTDDSLSGLLALINNYYFDNMVVDGNIWLPLSEMVDGYLHIRLARDVNSGGFILTQYSMNPLTPFYVKTGEDDVQNWSIKVFDMTGYYNDFQTFLNGYISGAYPNDKIRFPAMFNANLYGTDAYRDGELINGVNASGIIRNNANWGFDNGQPGVVKNVNSIQPFVLLKYVLDKTAQTLGFAWEGDFYDSLTTEHILIDNSQTLDDLQDFVGAKKFAFWRRSFNINEFVPDLTVVDFLKALQSRYNLAIYYNENTRKVRLQKRELIAAGSNYDDITGICSPVEGIDDQRVAGFVLRVKKETNDALSVEESLTIGEAETELPIACGRIQQQQSAIVNGGVVTGPYVSRENGADFNLRLFHYKGIVNNGVYSYPAAGIHGISFNESFSDLGNNLYKAFWQYWLQFQSNRLVVKLKVNFPLRRLLNFDWELKRRFDRSNYLVKSIELSINNSSVSVSDVELYTLR